MSSRRQKLRRSMKQQRKSLKRRNKTKSRTPKRSARRIMRGGVSRKRAVAATAVAAGVLATPFIYNKMKTGERVDKSKVFIARGGELQVNVNHVTQVGVVDEDDKVLSEFISVPYGDILNLFDFFLITISKELKQGLSYFYNQNYNFKKQQLRSLLPRVYERLNDKKVVVSVQLIQLAVNQTDLNNMLELIFAWYLKDCFFTTLLLIKEFRTDALYKISEFTKHNTARMIYWICDYYMKNDNRLPHVDAIQQQFKIPLYDSNLLLAAATTLLNSNKSIDKARLQCILEKYSATND